MENQRGIAQVILLLVLVAGLGSGVYLVQKTQVFAPQAREQKSTALEACQHTVAEFTVSEPCNDKENGYREATYTCVGENISQEIKNLNERKSAADLIVCKSVGNWYQEAKHACRKACIAALPSPTSAGSNQTDCPAVITFATGPQTGECKEFPTPCDVPQGWEKVKSCKGLNGGFF